MKKSVFNLFVGGILLSIVLAACLQTAPPIPNTNETEGIFAMNQRLGRGVNLGNALEAPNEGDWGMTLDANYFQLIAEAGFTSVRVPIRWSVHAGYEPPYAIDEAFFGRIDWVIERAKANELSVIINNHHHEEMMNDPASESPRFLALWTQIAERYQNEPPTVLFELLNEPYNAMTATRWNELLAEGITVVRQSNPTRAIIVGPVQWNSVDELARLKLPDDPNLIVTFHYYGPFEFTHQGAEWVDGSNAWLGTEWLGTEAEIGAIQREMDAAAKWAATQNRPLFMGEFGAYSKADQPSRERWTAVMAQSAQDRGISFAYWEFGAGFGVYDRPTASWNEGLRQALLEPRIGE